ncbi:MAG: thiamine pyrophosphate-dependent dehydrogenase E1 component subunit alpha [Desulfobacteraceae bacterium]|nr:MAG: thiamine pyrophosphate-dependent dehydrogenase E1 component subunit alpha [Desulfobacteraceae bacterium]
MTEVTVSEEKKRELFTFLLKSRRLEEKLIDMITRGEIAGWLHPSLGGEAVGVGVTGALKPKDYINNTHRGRPIIVTRGVPLKRFLLEVLGKKGGPCCGIAGEMHYADIEYGILGTQGMVGANIPLSVGFALACQIKNSGQVVVSYFGDGAVDEGNFHESVNMASVWKLPIVFAVENNRWAQFIPQIFTAAQPDIWRKAEGYNMPGQLVDGTNVLEVYRAAFEAVDRARRGEGPTLLECRFNRWLGHYVGDPQKYRDRKDIEAACQVDPVTKFREQLFAEHLLTAETVEKLEQAIKAEIEDAVDSARCSPPADPKTVFDNIYV